MTDVEEGAYKDEFLTLSTIHSAKGLEYKAVFIIGAVDGRFPSAYSFNSIEEMRQYVVYSEASGRTPVEFHHIVSRGNCPAAIDKAWNIVALTPDEHRFYHQKCKNWDEFLEVYPHLRVKVERAYRKCSELEHILHSTTLENIKNGVP